MIVHSCIRQDDLGQSPHFMQIKLRGGKGGGREGGREGYIYKKRV